MNKEKIYSVITMMCSLLVLCSCNDYRKLNEQNPYFKQAEQARMKNNYEAAEKLYLECLKFSPDSAKAHLQLGIIYEEQYKDYPRSIIHYQAYLNAVNGQNADVEKLLKRVEEAYYLQLKEEYGTGRPVAMADSRPQMPVPRPQVEAPAPPPQPAANEPPSNQSRFYVVQQGDNLSGISIKVYGTAKHWQRIFEANRDKLPAPEKLQIGQKLVIPEI